MVSGSARLASPSKAVIARRLERGAPRLGLFEQREGGGGEGGGEGGGGEGEAVKGREARAYEKAAARAAHRGRHRRPQPPLRSSPCSPATRSSHLRMPCASGQRIKHERCQWLNSGADQRDRAGAQHAP